MADVFISYSRDDRQRIQPLVEALEAEGFSVWWDPALVPGRRFRQTIAEELNRAAAVIVVWTRSALESDWVQDEAEEARQRGVLVPVILEPVTPPAGFRQVQAADLTQWRGAARHPEFRALVQALRSLVQAAAPAPLPEPEPEPLRDDPAPSPPKPEPEPAHKPIPPGRWGERGFARLAATSGWGGAWFVLVVVATLVFARTNELNDLYPFLPMTAVAPGAGWLARRALARGMRESHMRASLAAGLLFGGGVGAVGAIKWGIHSTNDLLGATMLSLFCALFGFFVWGGVALLATAPSRTRSPTPPPQ